MVPPALKRKATEKTTLGPQRRSPCGPKVPRSSPRHAQDPKVTPKGDPITPQFCKNGHQSPATGYLQGAGCIAACFSTLCRAWVMAPRRPLWLAVVRGLLVMRLADTGGDVGGCRFRGGHHHYCQLLAHGRTVRTWSWRPFCSGASCSTGFL